MQQVGQEWGRIWLAGWRRGWVWSVICTRVLYLVGYLAHCIAFHRSLALLLARSVLTITRPRLCESLLCLLLLLASDGFGLVELGAYRCIAR